MVMDRSRRFSGKEKALEENEIPLSKVDLPPFAQKIGRGRPGHPEVQAR